MANNKQQLLEDINEFLKSDDKCMLITGTNQYKKHLAIMASIDKYYKNATIIFRINSMQNVNGQEFLGRFIKKTPKSGERFRIGRNIYEVDSFNTKSTWYKTSNKCDFAIIYPLDAITRQDVSLQCIDDLFNFKDIGKIFLVSWTDRSDEYSLFNKYVDRKSIYDAEEEDIEYHKRVLKFRK